MNIYLGKSNIARSGDQGATVITYPVDFASIVVKIWIEILVWSLGIEPRIVWLASQHYNFAKYS